LAAAGNEEKAIADLRYGTEINADTDARIYLKYIDWYGSYDIGLNGNANDDWQNLRVGFRIDG
jgi:hypothetical protein